MFLPRNQQLIVYLLIFSYEVLGYLMTDFEFYFGFILLISNNWIFFGLLDFGLTFSYVFSFYFFSCFVIFLSSFPVFNVFILFFAYIESPKKFLTSLETAFNFYSRVRNFDLVEIASRKLWLTNG